MLARVVRAVEGMEVEAVLGRQAAAGRLDGGPPGALWAAGGAPNIRGKTIVFVILSGAKNLAVGIATADSSPPEGGSE